MGDRTKTLNYSVGRRIKELRTRANMTQLALSKIVNKGDSTVRMWELGKSEPDNETLIILAKTFNVPVDYLLGKSAEEIFEGFIDSLRDDFVTEIADRDCGATQKTADFVGEPLRSKLAAILEIDKIKNPDSLKAVLSLLSAFVACELPDDPSIPELEPGAGETRASELRAAVDRIARLQTNDLVALVQMADLRLRTKKEDGVK